MEVALPLSSRFQSEVKVQKLASLCKTAKILPFFDSVFSTVSLKFFRLLPYIGSKIVVSFLNGAVA